MTDRNTTNKNYISQQKPYENQSYNIKIVMIGDSGVGKTSIGSVFCDGSYYEDYVSTIGVDFKYKLINVHDKIIKIQLWDTAGQERFHSITTSYYRNADVILLVFDLSNTYSFYKLNQWIDEVHKNMPHDNYRLFLVGSKSDLKHDLIDQYDIDRFVKMHQINYYEVSSKWVASINKMFFEIAFESLELKHPSRSDLVIKKKKYFNKCC